MKFGVVVFSNTTCDHDVVHVLKYVMKQEVVRLWHKDVELPDFNKTDCIVLSGGGSGQLGASPIIEAIIDFAKSGGYVWGIGNGFQMLCKMGLLPGAILENESGRFVSKNVYLSPMTRKSAITAKLLDLEIPLKMPIAHAEGRYFADENTLSEMEDNDQVLFKYCEEGGEETAIANPNGSERNIAAVCNVGRNVFGMMPHPERAAEKELGNTDGKVLFEAIIETVNAMETV